MSPIYVIIITFLEEGSNSTATSNKEESTSTKADDQSAHDVTGIENAIKLYQSALGEVL